MKCFWFFEGIDLNLKKVMHMFGLDTYLIIIYFFGFYNLINFIIK